MKTIVCFGDSNTWGFDPASGTRHAHDVRWTGVLQLQLGAQFRLIEEGLNGRTTNLDDIIEEDRNGRRYIVPCLQSHQPVDLVTIMLGTNDLKARFARCASDIAQSAAALAQVAHSLAVGPRYGNPVVLLIAPPPVVELSDFDEMFAGAQAKSELFHHYYAVFAARNHLPFFDAGSVIHSSPIDGIHFEADQHETLGRELANEIRELLNS